MNDFEFNEKKPSVEEKFGIIVFIIVIFTTFSIIAIPITLISFAIFSYIKLKWKK